MATKSEGIVTKTVSVYTPAYVRMDLHSDGTGDFSLDDKAGWAWYGGNDEFLLGMLRVGSSRGGLYTKFRKELQDSNIKKEMIAEAIEKSIEKNPSDGLYHILGDNSSYLGFGLPEELIDEEDNIKECLEETGLPEEMAEDIAGEIRDIALWKTPSSQDIFNKLEKELAKDVSPLVGEKKEWKEFVKDAIDVCMKKEDTAEDFMDCVIDELLPLKEEGISLILSEHNIAAYNALSKVAKDRRVLSDIATRFGRGKIDVRTIERCITNA